MKINTPRHGTVVAYLALFIAMGGTAAAATGGSFVLGRANKESAKATLSNGAGTPLGLYAKRGYAPLAVNSTMKVGNLNADMLDGLSSSAFQRSTARSCTSGSFIKSISASGAVACAA